VDYSEFWWITVDYRVTLTQLALKLFIPSSDPRPLRIVGEIIKDSC